MSNDPFETPDDELPPADDAGSDEPIGDAPDDEFGSRVRFSRLKLLAKSPAHYFAHPEGDSDALDRGTAVHSVLLHGKRIAFYPKKTKAGKAAPRNGGEWEAFKSANSDAKIITAPEYEKVMRMVEAVRANRQAMEVLTGVVEETLLFDMLGLECRTTPDVRDPGAAFETELKTTVSADPRKFFWQSLKFAYHVQHAFHREGMKRTGKGTPLECYTVAVESSMPFPVTVMRMTPRAIEKGDKQIRFWMETLKGCLASNQWPPYAQNVVDLDVPEDVEEEFGDGAEPNTADSLPVGW